MRDYSGVAFGKAVDYHYRDPAWNTPEQLAELEARDRPERDAWLIDAARAAAARMDGSRERRVDVFSRLRESGLLVWEAARAMGISKETGRKYERARNGPVGQGHGGGRPRRRASEH